MKVSVITVVYSNEAFIEDAIESVLSQKYVDIEYIIVDGGSTDKTVDKIKLYGDKINILISEPDEGVYYALNKGVSLATGDIIAFLHSDDFYSNPFVLSQVVEAFIETQCDALYSNLYYVDEKIKDRIVRLWDSGTYLNGDFFKGWMPPHPAFFAKRSVYQKFGSFNTDFKNSADYEFMLRVIHKEKIKLHYIPKFFVRMRTGGTSNRSIWNRLRANLEDRKAWKINGLTPKWYTLLLKPAIKLKQYRFFSYLEISSK